MIAGVYIWGCSDDFCIFSFLSILDTLFLCILVLWPLDIHCTYIWFIYILMYVIHLSFPCVVSFLSLYTCFLYDVCNFIFLFHTKMPWWVLFKVFQEYKFSKSLLAKFFKSLCYDRFYCIQQVNMSWVFYDFFHMFICLLWFCHGLPKGEIVRTYVIWC